MPTSPPKKPLSTFVVPAHKRLNYPAVPGRLDLGNFNKEIGPDILGSMIMRDEMDKTEYGVK